MRSALRTLFLATAALGAAVALYVAVTVAPAAIHLDGAIPTTQVVGAYHVHTVRSDGTGTVDQIAAAAAKARLAFVIFTDHGDATRVPDRPSYRSGVLCIDAVEINTAAGHVVALDLPGAAPYPLAGDGADVIEDIHRMGGVAVIAHPDSPNRDLRWRATNAVPFDGIEWLNADSEWRDETPRHLIATAARSLVRGPESIASLFSPPVRTFARWDNASLSRPIFGLAALDAHASIPWRDSDESTRRTALARPSYFSMFETLAQSVILDTPLSGHAEDDARRLLDAIVHGRSFSIVRAFADPASLAFIAEQGSVHARMGGRLDTVAPTMFRAEIPQAPGARLQLLRDGRVIASTTGRLEHVDQAAGVYRVVATLPDRVMPWIVSNAIGMGPFAAIPAPPTDEPEVREWFPLRGDTHPWAIERDPTSTATMTSAEGEVGFAFHLGSGVPNGQYGALVSEAGTDAGVDRVRFTGRADRPMRVSLQVRMAKGSRGRRWRRSVYLDTTPRTVTVKLEDFEPADSDTSNRPVVAPLHSVLFVADTLNSTTGSQGAFWVSDVALGLRDP